jgi:hypothetical protein
MNTKKNKNSQIDNFALIKIDSSNILEIALLHKNIFFNSFSSRLGRNYLEKMFEWFIISDKRFLIGLKVNDIFVGYVGGALGMGSTSGMMQYAYWEGVKAIIYRPYLIFNLQLLFNFRLIIKNIFKRIFLKNINLKETKIIDENQVSTGLVVIGVDKKFRKMNLGTILLSEFNKQSKKMNSHQGHLAVKSENIAAIKTYIKNGWEIVSSDKNYSHLRIIFNE